VGIKNLGDLASLRWPFLFFKEMLIVLGNAESILNPQGTNAWEIYTVVDEPLTSPIFQELGPDAQGLLGVVALFPQDINEGNIDWLFLTISNRTNILNPFPDILKQWIHYNFGTTL